MSAVVPAGGGGFGAMVTRKPCCVASAVKVIPTIWPALLMPYASVPMDCQGIVEGGVSAAAVEEAVVRPRASLYSRRSGPYR